MKLYRMANGLYTLRKDQPLDHFDRPVWTEVTLGFRSVKVATYSTPRGELAQVYPVDKADDQVTLTFRESNVLKMLEPILSVTQMQLVLREFFLARAPDRLLDQYAITYVEGNGQLDYIEWERKEGEKDPSAYGNFSKGLDEEEGVPQHIADALVRQALIAAGDL